MSSFMYNCYSDKVSFHISFEDIKKGEAMQKHNPRPRLMIDISPELRRRIKIAAAQNDLSVREYIERILEQTVPGEANVILAPVLLIYEVTNAIYQHVRRGELFLDDARQTLDNALLAFLELDSPVDSSLSRRAMELAQQYRLPATYDAHYLALAEREQCDYWTADTRLWNAVKGKLAWVRWLGDYQTDVS